MNPFLLLTRQFLGFVHCKNKSGKSLTKVSSWCWLHCVNNPVLWRPSEFPAPNPLVHTSTLLAKGTSLRKGEELLSLHEKAAKSDQEEALRWVQQTETSAFSLPLNINFQLFIQENYIEGNRGQVKKNHPKVTTDIDTANTMLLEKVVNLPPDICHHCVAQGF